MAGDRVALGERLDVDGVLKHDVAHFLDVLELGGREVDMFVVVVGEKAKLADVRVQRIDVEPGVGQQGKTI